jgi:hypothetical protein
VGAMNTSGYNISNRQKSIRELIVKLELLNLRARILTDIFFDEYLKTFKSGSKIKGGK